VVDDLSPSEIRTQNVIKNEVFPINIGDGNTIHGLYINSEGYKEKYILVAIEMSDN
jgi:hypothetical protein